MGAPERPDLPGTQSGVAPDTTIVGGRGEVFSPWKTTAVERLRLLLSQQLTPPSQLSSIEETGFHILSFLSELWFSAVKKTVMSRKD